MFDHELLRNRALTEDGVASMPPYPELIGKDYDTGRMIPTGALLQDDGSVLFRIYAPGNTTARVVVGPYSDAWISLVKNEEGFFEGTLPYDHRWRGPQDVAFYLDETLVIHPHMPVHFRCFRLMNFVEFPDPESDIILQQDVPHGQVIREEMYSQIRGSWQRLVVYLPPQYRSGTDDYPVLYLQHGLSENENEWINMGKVHYLMDNLIAQGKCVPFIIVMTNGMERLPGEGFWDYDSFERVLLEEFIPYIEENYRVKADRKYRGMAGLSMGSMQTGVFGLKHPDVFSSLGIFSGFLRNGLHGDVRDTHMRVMYDDPDYLRKNYDVFFRSMGTGDTLYSYFLDDKRIIDELDASGDNCHEIVYEGLTHDWSAFRRGMRDFAQLIFRK